MQTQQIEAIKKATIYLASNCDGANTQDGQGFNKPDSHLGKWAAMQFHLGGIPEASDIIDLSEKLQKYQGQLSSAGIVLPEAIDESELPEAVYVEPSVFCHVDGNKIVISFENDATLRNKVKAITGRKFNWDKKVWTIDTSKAGELAEAFPNAMGLDQVLEATKDIKPVAKVQIKSHNGGIAIVFDYDESVLNIVRGLSDRSFNRVPFVHWFAPKRIAAEVVEAFDSVPDVAIEAEIMSAVPAEKPAQKDPRVTIKVTGNGLMVCFKYDQEIHQIIKSVTGRKFVTEPLKHWRVPFTSAAELLDAFKDVEDCVIDEAEIAQIIEDQKGNLAASSAENSDFTVEGLAGELMPFQRSGVEYVARSGKAIIADDMGTGKTIQALATLQHRNAFPALIVVPASLKINWQIEANKWLPNKTTSILSGRKEMSPEAYGADIIIINYDILAGHVKAIKKAGITAIVADESHYIKNSKAARTKHSMTLAEGCETKIALTGTPVLNKPIELASQLEFIDRFDEFGSWWNFATEYCGAYRGSFGIEFGSPRNLKQLGEKMRTGGFFLRRTKDQVLKELPAKRRSIIMTKLSNRREYNRAESDLISWVGEQAERDAEFLESISDLSPEMQDKAKKERRVSAQASAERAEHLVRIAKLKKLSALGKVKAVAQWVEDFVETDEKLIVFAHHKEIVKVLADKFGADTITGDVPMQKRQEAVERFQNDPEAKVIVLNIKAGGVGLTLTAASNVLFIEQDWNAANMDQAEDRAHRIGQENAVNIWNFVGIDTIDTDISELIESKRAMSHAITDEAVSQRGVIKAIMAGINKRNQK